MSRYLTFLMVALLASGCAIPKHTIGLDRVLKEEGLHRRQRYKFRCTRGAHRGASEEHKENTLAALKSAEADDKFAFIEFDIQYSKDGVVVVFHDKTMLRTFGRMKNIGKTTYADLVKATKGEIATYSEAMPLLKKKLNIEIKSQGDDEEDRRLVDYVMKDLQERRRLNDVLISSISEDVVKYVNQKYPRMPTGQIFWLKTSTYIHADILTEKLYTKITESEADYLMMHVANLRNIHDLLTLKPNGKTIVFWDFDDRMYIVHKDILSDRMWGSWPLTSFLRSARYTAARWLRMDRKE